MFIEEITKAKPTEGQVAPATFEKEALTEKGEG
jgi:hypothetical protein